MIDFETTGIINESLQLEVRPPGLITVPNREAATSSTSNTLGAYLARDSDCRSINVTLASALEAIPGSTVKYGINFNYGGYRQRWFVLPPRQSGCGCEPYPDYYDILSRLKVPDEVEYDDSMCSVNDIGLSPSPFADDLLSPYIDEGSLTDFVGSLPPIQPWLTPPVCEPIPVDG